MDNRFTFDYQIKNSKLAKNIRITIKPNQKVILTKPWFIPQYIALQFLIKNQNWVIDKLNKIKKISTSNPSIDTLYYHGEKYSLIFKEGKFQISTSSTTLTVYSYSKTSGKRALIDKLKKEARLNIKTSVQKYSKIMNQKYNQVRLKDQSTRWGSASSKNNLNFNWRLIMAPPEVLDYVVIHELAHFNFMDHSRKFWQYVQIYDPDYREHRRWLHRHQNELSTFSS